MATREEIVRIIGYMKLAFPNYVPDITSDPNTIDVFEDLLGDLDGETLMQGVKAACKQDRAWAPAPGEIRAAAAALPVNYDPMASLTTYLAKKRKK